MTEPEPNPSILSEEKTVPETPTQPTLEDLKARKITALETRIQFLNAEIASTRTKLEAVREGLKAPAKPTVLNHIQLLHSYNEIKDIGQGLIGMVVDGRNASSQYYQTRVGGDRKGEEKGDGEGNGGGRGEAREQKMYRVKDIMGEFGVGVDD